MIHEQGGIQGENVVTINLEPKQLLKIKVILLFKVPERDPSMFTGWLNHPAIFSGSVLCVCVVSVWGSLQRAVSELVTQPDVDGEGMGLFPSHICLTVSSLSSLN